MPDCVLRVAGPDFPVDEFLRSSSLQPCKVFRTGEATVRGKATESGFNVVVGTGETLVDQVSSTILFLRNNAHELDRLRSFPGAEKPVLDFSLYRRDVLAQYDSFPLELVRLAAEFGLAIALSQYAAQQEENVSAV